MTQLILEIRQDSCDKTACHAKTLSVGHISIFQTSPKLCHWELTCGGDPDGMDLQACSPAKGGTTTSPNGRITAVMRLPLETSMLTEFIHFPPVQRIHNRNPPFFEHKCPRRSRPASCSSLQLRHEMERKPDWMSGFPVQIYRIVGHLV